MVSAVLTTTSLRNTVVEIAVALTTSKPTTWYVPASFTTAENWYGVAPPAAFTGTWIVPTFWRIGGYPYVRFMTPIQIVMNTFGWNTEPAGAVTWTVPENQV